jgi:hypothetical protein
MKIKRGNSVSFFLNKKLLLQPVDELVVAHLQLGVILGLLLRSLHSAGLILLLELLLGGQLVSSEVGGGGLQVPGQALNRGLQSRDPLGTLGFGSLSGFVGSLRLGGQRRLGVRLWGGGAGVTSIQRTPCWKPQTGSVVMHVYTLPLPLPEWAVV